MPVSSFLKVHPIARFVDGPPERYYRVAFMNRPKNDRVMPLSPVSGLSRRVGTDLDLRHAWPGPEFRYPTSLAYNVTFRFFRIALQVLPGLLTGCVAPGNAVEVHDRGASNVEVRYAEAFEEGYFHTDADGTVDIVLRDRAPSRLHPNDDIRQLLHIRTLWRSIPGDTIAESAQVNARVSYVLRGREMKECYTGGGSVFFKKHRRGSVLRGSLDRALLRPIGPVTGNEPLFVAPTLRGSFRVVRDARRTTEIINEIDRELTGGEHDVEH